MRKLPLVQAIGLAFPLACVAAEPAPADTPTKLPRRRRRHRQPADLAAHPDPHHHRGHQGHRGRREDQRHRRRRRDQVLPQPAGAQALHRRLQPRGAVQPRFGHRQQRALDGVRRRHPAVQLPRQRCDLHAALGPGDARGDRARRCALRAVLGGLPGQLGWGRG